MNEDKLLEKLRLVEALHAGATTRGEQVAAENARERILERLRLLERDDPPREYTFHFPDRWRKAVFVALLRRYNLEPYRYKGQRYTTCMAKVSKRFVDETLWPEYEELAEILYDYLAEVTERVLSTVLDVSTADAEVVDKSDMQMPSETNLSGISSPVITSEDNTDGTKHPPRAKQNKNKKKRKRKPRKKK